MNNVYIFGDSIMKGVLLNPESGKYTLDESMPKTLEDTFKTTIINKSIFGSTISRGSVRIGQFLEKDPESGLAIVEFGGNDCDFAWAEVAATPDEEHLPKTPLSEYKESYVNILKSLKDRGFMPVVLTLPPIDAVKYFKRIVETGNLCGENILKWLGDVQMIYRFQELYSNTAFAVARSMNCLVADVRSYFLDKHDFTTSLICEDGIHPNENGHRLICSAIADTVLVGSPA